MSLPQGIQDDTRLAAEGVRTHWNTPVVWGAKARNYHSLVERLGSGQAIVVPLGEWMPKRLRDAYIALAEDYIATMPKTRGYSRALAELEAAKKEAGL